MTGSSSIRRRIAGTLGVAALLLVAAAAPTMAETDVHKDAESDVVRINDWSYREAPYNQRADIVGLETDHDGWQLELVVDLRRVRTQLSVSSVIKTPDARFLGWVSWRSGEIVDVELRRWTGARVCRSGLDASVDTGTDQVVFAVPRHCLDHPEWVRTGAVSFSWADPDDTTTYFADDARTGDGYADGDFPVLGQRVHHN